MRTTRRAELIKAARRLANDLDAQSSLREIDRLSISASNIVPVATLGEPTAKTPVLNELLGSEFLDPYIGGDRVRIVRPGPQALLSPRPDGSWSSGCSRQEWRAFEEEWPEATAYMRVPSRFLEDLAIEVFDLPPVGVKDFIDGYRRTVRSCRFFAFFIDAASLLTRSESQILKELSTALSPQCTGVLVTNLDRVDADERQAVVSRIEKTIRNTGYGSTPVLTGSTRELSGALTEHLTADIRRTQTKLGKEWGFVAELTIVSMDLADAAQQNLRAKDDARDAIESAKRQLVADAASDSRAIDEARRGSNRRCLDFLSELSHDKVQREEKAFDRFQDDLKRESDPIAWWNQEADMYLNALAQELWRHAHSEADRFLYREVRTLPKRLPAGCSTALAGDEDDDDVLDERYFHEAEVSGDRSLWLRLVSKGAQSATKAASKAAGAAGFDVPDLSGFVSVLFARRIRGAVAKERGRVLYETRNAISELSRRVYRQVEMGLRADVEEVFASLKRDRLQRRDVALRALEYSNLDHSQKSRLLRDATGLRDNLLKELILP
jgi:hypothetical protein